MLKTASIYRLIGALTQEVLSIELPEQVTEATIVDPLKTQWSTAGFAHPECFGSSPIFVGHNEVVVFDIQVRERVLPGKVIAMAVKEQAAEDEHRQGYKPGRKQLAEIREAVTMRLLPTSHVKPTDVRCMIAGGYLFIGTGSARLVDTVLSVLRGTFPDVDLQFQMLARGRDTVNFMSDLLLMGSTESELFTCGDSVVLKSSTKATARIRKMDLHAEVIKNHITNGMKPVEISVQMEDSILFTLTESMVIKSIKFADILINQINEDAKDDPEALTFDATVAISASTFLSLVNRLVEEIPTQEEKDQSTNEDDEL